MIDFLEQIPKITTGVDFAALGETLSEREATIISRVNGLISLKEMATGLGIPFRDVTQLATGLLKRELICFEDPRVAQEVLGSLKEEEVDEPSPRPEAAAGASAVGAVARAEGAQEAVIRPLDSGKWDIHSIFSTIIKIYTDNATGLLRIHNDRGRHKSLYFDQGELVQVLSHPFDPGQCLGRILQRAGRLPKDMVIESLKRAKTSGQKQGEELVRMGQVRRTALPEILVKQIEVKLRDILDWGSGHWEFYALPDLVAKITHVEIPLSRLLFNVIFKYYDFKKKLDVDLQIKRKFIGAVDPPPFLMDTFNLTENTELLWDSIKAKDNPFQRLLIVGKLNVDNLAKFVWTMHLCGMILILDQPRISERDIRIKKLSERLRFIGRESYFDVVGIHWTRNTQEIKQAYELSHAEQLELLETSEGTEKSLREQLIAAMEKGYRIIKSKDTRDSYRKQIYDDMFIEYSSDLLRQKGESFLFTKEDYETAIREMEGALEIWDANAEYYSVLGLAVFLDNFPKNTQRYSEGRRTLLRGYRDSNTAEVSNICMGIMYREERKNHQAIEFLGKVLKINEKNRFAQILIQEIKTGKKHDDRERAIKEFLERETEIDKKFNRKFDRVRKKKKKRR